MAAKMSLRRHDRNDVLGLRHDRNDVLGRRP